MDYVVVPAPEGFRATWRVMHGEEPETDLLIIEVSDDLRPLDRRRHIQQALQWAWEQFGVEPHRRRIVPLPLLPGKPLRHAVGGHKAAATVVGVAGAGILAVGIAPALLHDNNTDSIVRRPLAAAPAPRWPGRPPNDPPPPAPSRPHRLPQTPPSALPSVALELRPAGLRVHAGLVSAEARVRVPSVHTPLPKPLAQVDIDAELP